MIVVEMTMYMMGYAVSAEFGLGHHFASSQMVPIGHLSPCEAGVRLVQVTSVPRMPADWKFQSIPYYGFLTLPHLFALLLPARIPLCQKSARLEVYTHSKHEKLKTLQTPQLAQSPSFESSS